MTRNDISRELAYENDYLFPLLPKSGKVFTLTYTYTFRNHVTNRDYNYKKQQSGKKKDGE